MYTDICIALYFDLWLFSERMVNLGFHIPWKLVLDIIDGHIYGDYVGDKY